MKSKAMKRRARDELGHESIRNRILIASVHLCPEIYHGSLDFLIDKRVR
jgi:hypothetical protein